MKLYGVKGSPFVRKALVALEEKGLPYELETMVSVNPKSPELLALHPLGKIPVLRDGDVVVPDSSVICAYLEKKLPSPALYPDDPAELAKALFLEEYADTRMFEVLGPILFERVVKRFVMKQEPGRGARGEAPRTRAAAGARLSRVPARRRPRDGAARASASRTSALGAQLATLTLSGIEIDAARWPRTARYYAGAPGAPFVQDRDGRLGHARGGSHAIRPALLQPAAREPARAAARHGGRRDAGRDARPGTRSSSAPASSARCCGSPRRRRPRRCAGNGDEVLVTDGPFAETKEILGGLAILECADLDEALAFAKRCPLARIGTVEVRPEFGPPR